MSKPNAFLAKMEAKYTAKMMRLEQFSRAMCQDAAVYAANRVFHVGVGRIVPFVYEFTKALREFSEMINLDRMYDKDLIYAKAKIDELVLPIYGDLMVPFDERYGITPLTDEMTKLSEKQQDYMAHYMKANYPDLYKEETE